MVDVTAWLPEMLLLLNTIESPDITVSPAEQEENPELWLHKDAPTTNDREPP
jgi:hypothetical protein